MAYQINLAFLLLLLPLPIVLLLLPFLPGRVEHIVRTLPLNNFCELTCWLLILLTARNGKRQGVPEKISDQLVRWLGNPLRVLRRLHQPFLPPVQRNGPGQNDTGKS